MRCVECEDSGTFDETHLARIQHEKETITKRIAALTKQWEALEEQKRQMAASLERNKDLELDAEFPRMIKRGTARVTGKQEVLKKKQEELTRQLKVLERNEQQAKALLGHEKYPEMLELKKKRDEALAEVKRLEAEMTRLMERIVLDTCLK